MKNLILSVKTSLEKFCTKVFRKFCFYSVLASDFVIFCIVLVAATSPSLIYLFGCLVGDVIKLNLVTFAENSVNIFWYQSKVAESQESEDLKPKTRWLA